LGLPLGVGVGTLIFICKVTHSFSQLQIIMRLFVLGEVLTKLNPCNVLKDNTIIIQRGNMQEKQKGKRFTVYLLLWKNNFVFNGKKIN
jgi:hypothetical protein